jgi:hypothetical protein
VDLRPVQRQPDHAARAALDPEQSLGHVTSSIGTASARLGSRAIMRCASYG